MSRELSGASTAELASMVAAHDLKAIADVIGELAFRKTRKAHALASVLGAQVKSGAPYKHLKAGKRPEVDAASAPEVVATPKAIAATEEPASVLYESDDEEPMENPTECSEPVL